MSKKQEVVLSYGFILLVWLGFGFIWGFSPAGIVGGLIGLAALIIGDLRRQGRLSNWGAFLVIQMALLVIWLGASRVWPHDADYLFFVKLVSVTLVLSGIWTLWKKRS